MSLANAKRVVDLVRQIDEHKSAMEAAETELESMIAVKPAASRKRAKKTAGKRKVGRPKSNGSPAAKSKPKAKAKPKGKKNAQPLTKLIPQILAYKDDDAVWMTHAQIVSAALKRGYDSASDDFNNIVYQNLRKKVRDGELVYDDDQSKFALAYDAAEGPIDDDEDFDDAE